MAGSAGWAMITYRELALLLEQRTSFILKTCSHGQAFVVGVRICKVTVTRELELEGGFSLLFLGKALSNWKMGF